MFNNLSNLLPCSDLQPQGILFWLNPEDDQLYQCYYLKMMIAPEIYRIFTVNQVSHHVRVGSTYANDYIFDTYPEALEKWKQYLIQKRNDLEKALQMNEKFLASQINAKSKEEARQHICKLKKKLSTLNNKIILF